MTEQFSTPYEILGDAGVKQLANAFYDVMDELTETAEIRQMHCGQPRPHQTHVNCLPNGLDGRPSGLSSYQGYGLLDRSS